MKDEVLTAIAQLRPATVAELAEVRGLDRRMRERHGEAIVRAVTEAAEREPVPHERGARRAKATPATLARARLLDAWVHHRAAELDIAPATLVPPAALERGRPAPLAVERALRGSHRRVDVRRSGACDPAELGAVGRVRERVGGAGGRRDPARADQAAAGVELEGPVEAHGTVRRGAVGDPW